MTSQRTDPQPDAATDYAARILDRTLPAIRLAPATAPDATIAVGVGPGLSPTGSAADLLAERGVDLPAAATAADFKGKAGSVLTLTTARGRVLCVGTGDGSAVSLRRAGAALARACRRADVVETDLADGRAPELVEALVEGALLGAFSPIALGSTSRPAAVGTITLTGTVDPAAVEAARRTAETGWLARDLAGAPSSVKNPPWLAQVAADLAERAGLAVEVLAGGQLDGFGALLAVGGASPSPPRLVVLRHRPPDPLPGARHVLVVGKGITFDTGGLNLKPGEALVPMRTDMTGAAAALAAVVGVARAGLRQPVTAILALAENSIGGNAYRPGDVLTTWDGTTVEIGNTDAEGRLVLADALGYGVATGEPDVVVDLATLTGAATLGLGRTHAALYSVDDALAQALSAAGGAAGERVWRMPLVEDYREALDSEVADVNHIATTGRFGGGGSITAALFLQRFTGGHPRWAHLDIAGPARADKEQHENPKGPTGFGARLLLRWLRDADRPSPDPAAG